MQEQSFVEKWLLELMLGGGVGQTLLTNVQNLQNWAAKVVLGHPSRMKSNSQRMKQMNWMTVKQEVKIATLRLAHRIVHRNIPEEMTTKMPLNQRSLKIKKTFKLAAKPRELTTNKLTQTSFRSRAYEFNTLPHRLTSIKDHKSFNKWLKIFIQDPNKLPNPIPPPGTQKLVHTRKT